MGRVRRGRPSAASEGDHNAIWPTLGDLEEKLFETKRIVRASTSRSNPHSARVLDRKSLRSNRALSPWPGQCDPVENFANKKVSLNGGQVFSYDLIVQPQTKQASRVAWSFKLNGDPLD